MIPKYVFFTRGVGTARKELESFETALRDAGISQVNLVQVSSILPPKCIELNREEGLSKVKPGQIIFTVLARHTSNEGHRAIAASIGVAKPRNADKYGYLSEHHSFGQNEKIAGDYAEDLAASMLASTLGIEFNVDANYDEKREIFMMSNEIVETKSITSSTRVEIDGEFTTVVAAAVFLME